MLALDNRESADSRSNKDSRPLGQFGRNHQAGLLHRVIGRCDGVMDEGIHLLDVFLFEPLQRIEVLNLSSNLGGKLGGVESGNCRDAAASFAEALPCLFGSRAQRGYQPHAGNNDSSFLQIRTSLQNITRANPAAASGDIL